MDYNYWELRKAIANIIPRIFTLEKPDSGIGAIKEKGRKRNYYQFNIEREELLKNERLLNTEEINSFAEISLRAAGCPMPLNLDVWDGLRCGFGCRYCYADNFRASLYTSFFDNSKSMGMRHCNPTFYKKELDILLKGWGTPTGQGVQRAISMGIPLRFGIRFEDFLPIEGKEKVSLSLLQYLADVGYPVMINSKADLLARDDYVKALADNSAGAAVHMTLISANNELLKKLEPGAPSYEKRLAAMRVLSDAGIRVVARIEPYMTLVNDRKEDVEKYLEEVWATGCRHITFDTYSYSANNPGIRASFYEQGIDFQRMFLLTSDSQGVGSLLLTEFIKLFSNYGFSCGTFDLGSAPNNSQMVCCEVGDFFKGTVGFNYGSIISAIRYVQAQKGKPVSWKSYEKYVIEKGGFLSDKLHEEVKRLWNLSGNAAFSICWARGLVPHGEDEHGLVWKFDEQDDFRKELLETIV